MAPGDPNPRRKRGRQPAASRAVSDATGLDENAAAQAASDARPRKRRKPQQEAEVEVEAEQTQPEATKRSRRQRGAPAASPEGAGPSKQGPANRRGQRNRQTEEQPRRSAQEQRQPATQESPEPIREAAKKRGKAKAAGPEKAAASSKPRRGRALAEVSVSKVQNQSSPPPRDQEQPPKQRRSRASDDAGSTQESSTSAPTTQPSKSASKKGSSTEDATNNINNNNNDDNDNDTPDAYRPFPMLTTLTRHIPRATIASKWTPLDGPSVEAISSILADCALPVLHRLRDRDARYAQAQSILNTFSARLRSKLVKGMPFPPPSLPAAGGRKGKPEKGGSHAAEFDYEQAVATIAGLERALDPLLHSVALLEAEKEREEKALERDYAALRKLEGNARAQARGWREGGGKGREHVLAAGIGGGAGRDKGDAGRADLGLEIVTKGEREVGVFRDLQEDELLALSQQISNHMESMQNNLGQIDGILPAIAKSRAALQGTLCEHLDPEQYEQVVLG
ncbi:hypothetical protein VTJ83DRAFT_6838 [Remersonia thermophila]|uniref:Uncharacterized protein n=1 Tax=Remersonia thermophila TaxID=72144 RepID=A0ABR4D5X7_9PEZI